MKIRENFNIIKGIPNVCKLSRSKIDSIRLKETSIERMSSMLDLAASSVYHPTNTFISDLSRSLKKKNSPVVPVSVESYPLFSIYNIPTNQVLLNVVPFRVEEVVRIPIRNLYATCIYSLTFRSAAFETIPVEHVGLISSFFLSVFFKLFGRKYGLLASYSSLISDLKYILTVYTAVGLFGLKQNEELYKRAAAASSFGDYQKYDLDNFDFSNLKSVISALNQLQIFPGFNDYEFVNRVTTVLNLQFLPMFEDLPRLLSTIIACDIPGNSIFPSFIKSFNKSVFMSLTILASRTLKKHKSKLQI